MFIDLLNRVYEMAELNRVLYIYIYQYNALDIDPFLGPCDCAYRLPNDRP